MQQIETYDRELNYLPYRYRHRSSTKPKNKHYTGSSSRPKETKNPPQRLAWEHCRPSHLPQEQTPLPLFGGSDILVEQVRLGPQRERDPEESDSLGEDNDAVSVASELQLRQTNHWREAESEYENEEQGHDQNTSPINKLQETSQKPHQNSPFIIEGEKEEQGHASPQKMSSIFDESDVRQIKENILNNIHQSSSQQSLQQPPNNPLPEQPHTNEPSLSLPATLERVNLDVRFQRIRAINQQYQQEEEFSRNLKRIKMMKKSNKIKQIKYTQKNYKQEGGNPQIINASPLSHESPPPAGKVSTINPKQTKNEIIHIQQPSDPPIILQTKLPEQPHREIPSIQREKQAIAHNHSINTTNSSLYARYNKQANSTKPPPPEILTFEKYKQSIKSNQKQSPQDQSSKKTSHKKTYPHLSPFPSESTIKMERTVLLPVQTQPPQQQHINQVEVLPSLSLLPPTNANDLLSQFSKSTPNKAMLQAKAAKSQQKQLPRQATHKDSPIGYGSNKQLPLPSGYRNKQIHNAITTNETYSHNMKKKKDHTLPMASPNRQAEKVPSSINNNSNINHNDFLRIQQQSPTRHPPAQHQSKSYSSSLIPHSQQSNTDNNIQIPTVQPPPLQTAHTCPLKQSDLLKLQQGITIFLTFPSPAPQPTEILHHQQAPSQASSQAASRVIDHMYPLQQLKSQDGQQLLKIMAVNTNNFKELSSLLIQDKSPDPHDDLSLMSNQLGEIVVNSNQSELSATPTPQHVSISSSSLNYPFEGHYQQAFGYDDEEEGDGRQRVDSRLIQINEDSLVFQQKLHPLPLQNKSRITPFFQQQQLPPSSHPPSSRPPSSNHAVVSTSTLEYRNHFHPSSAIRKYKHAKHNSEEFREKSLHSTRINHSLSTFRRNGLSLESSERVRSRLERNRSRFKTRMGEQSQQ